MRSTTYCASSIAGSIATTAPEGTEPPLHRSRYVEPWDDRQTDRHEEIARAAYQRAEERGFEPGHAVDDWLAAEKEIDARAAIARGITPGLTRRADDAA